MNSPIGEIRPAQLITTFGPGAIFDAKMDSLTILDLKYWDHQGHILRDSRLASFLKVSYFVKPKTSNYMDLPVISFPNYHICSKCHLLFDIRQNFDLIEYQKKGPLCPECHKNAYPARFVISCEANHLDDFPWVWWVHNGNKTCNGKIYIETTGQTSSLGDIIAKCTCGASRSMIGATDPAMFKDYNCTGNHPFRPGDKRKQCNAATIPLQRGASNVYFPVLRSALSIPPWINPIDELIDQHFHDIETVIKYGGNLQKIYEERFKYFTFDQFKEALKRKQQEIDKYSQIKEMEYDALINHTDFDISIEKYFKAEDEEVPENMRPYFSRIIKIHRLREILVLLGFTRNSSPEPEDSNPSGIVWLNSNEQNGKWLPAIDVNGEGIFIEFNKKTLAEWRHQIESHDTKLSSQYSMLYKEWIKRKGWTFKDNKDAIYVMLHTFAHILIKELSNECGYSSTALKERIYYKDNLKMAGILIYTGTSDQEGSLGGLVEMGNKEKLIPLILLTLENAILCTNDPLCSTILPADETMNGSACHSCCMISETSCENGNILLDRSLVVSLPERTEKGYFEGLI